MKIKIFLFIILTLICINVNGLCADYEKSNTFDLSLKQIDTVVLIKSSNIAGELHSQGSGVIISEDGIILTNFHVINQMFGANVTLTNGSNYTVEKVIGYNKELDMALLKIDAKKLAFAKVGNSSNVTVGDYIMAIGNPQGLTSTVSEGIISGIRNEKGIQQIQITAQIDHGSSGGGLFNTNGELIGVTTSGYGTGNLNFCLAINQLKNLTDNPVNFSFADLNKMVYGGKKLYEVEKIIKETYYENLMFNDFIHFNDISIKQDNKNNLNIKVILLGNGIDKYVKFMTNYSVSYSARFEGLKSLLEEIRSYVKVSFPDRKVNIELLTREYLDTYWVLPYMNDITRKSDNIQDPNYELPIMNIIEFNHNKTYSFFNFNFDKNGW